jgi:hypothetical protein
MSQVELEREQPAESTPAPQPMNDSQPWHKTWNPLILGATEEVECNEPNNFALCMYQYICTVRHIFYPAWPMFVFLGDPFARPRSEYSILYYCLFIGMVLHSSAMVLPDYFRMKKNRIQASFFKILLLVEWRREFSSMKKLCLLLQAFNVGTILLMAIKVFPDQLKDCRALNATCTEFEPPSDSPQLSSISFVILMVTYLKSVWDMYSYNDVYHELMFPGKEFMEKHYPEELKIAQQRFPEGGHSCLFEPNIPIRADGSWWMFTDTTVVFKNILIVCSRVVAIVDEYDSAIDKSKSVGELRNSSQLSAEDKKEVMDEALGWGCAAAQHECISLSKLTRVSCRHIEHMSVADVLKLHKYLNTGLLHFMKPKDSLA